ncbi:hypothetical protein PR048_012408 [Dryococelus australis]|uniref:Uncharacterized protein n=1 Tax=Dryococelus australis TaxID=614101 RepID=A0ABQ9HPA9_9NEOP|nr:hypothetical protein PR048_012408 [Dryococelus australis]
MFAAFLDMLNMSFDVGNGCCINNCFQGMPQIRRATVTGRLARSPPTKANRAQSPAGSPDFRKWESCWTMPLVGGFSRGSPVSHAPSVRHRSIFTSVSLIGPQDLAFKSLSNLFTHSLIGFIYSSGESSERRGGNRVVLLDGLEVVDLARRLVHDLTASHIVHQLGSTQRLPLDALVGRSTLSWGVNSSRRLTLNLLRLALRSHLLLLWVVAGHVLAVATLCHDQEGFFPVVISDQVTASKQRKQKASGKEVGEEAAVGSVGVHRAVRPSRSAPGSGGRCLCGSRTRSGRARGCADTYTCGEAEQRAGNVLAG